MEEQNSKRTAAPISVDAPLPAKKYSRRKFLRHLALGTALAPLGWWDRAKAFPGYLGFFKKKIVSTGLPPSTNTLFVWGNNLYSQTGTPYSRYIPRQIGTGTDWSSLVGASWYNYSGIPSYVTDPTHDAAIFSLGLRGGQLWAWGGNMYTGALGLSDVVPRSEPTQVGSLSTWSNVAIGAGQYANELVCAGVTSDGKLWTWGYGGYGSLGRGVATEARSSPTQVGALTNWSKISSGGYHMAAVKTDGTLWTWGRGTHGMLGSGAVASRSSPVQVGALTNWSKIYTSSYFTVAIKTNGTLWAWGLNTVGQVGDSTIASRSSPVQIGAVTTWSKAACGLNHTIAVRTDGTLWGWGQNYYGQLGTASGANVSAPLQIGALATWNDVAAGPFWSMARKTDGTIWVFGMSNYGLGAVPNGVTHTSPVQVGTATNWSGLQSGIPGGTTSDGKAWLWGASELMSVRACNWPELSPVQIGAANEWQSVASALHTFGVKSNGTLWAWGKNEYGELGLGDSTPRYSPVQVGSMTNWSKVAAGGSWFSVAIKTDGTLWGWGYHYFGAAGPTPSTVLTSSPVQIGTATNWSTVVAGRGACTALKTDGTLWAWGGFTGYMGDEYYDTNGDVDGDSTYPAVIYDIHTSPEQIGSATWKQTSGTADSYYLIKSDDTLWFWGRSGPGELYYLDTFTPPSSMTQIGSGTWKHVSAHNHVLAVRSDGTLWAWGLNTVGQLGLGNTTYTSSPIQVGTGTNWVKACAGELHSYALKSDGTLWAWGNNVNGQQGNPSSNYAAMSSPVQVGTSTNWTDVPSGYIATTVLK